VFGAIRFRTSTFATPSWSHILSLCRPQLLPAAQSPREEKGRIGGLRKIFGSRNFDAKLPIGHSVSIGLGHDFLRFLPICRYDGSPKMPQKMPYFGWRRRHPGRAGRHPADRKAVVGRANSQQNQRATAESGDCSATWADSAAGASLASNFVICWRFSKSMICGG